MRQLLLITILLACSISGCSTLSERGKVEVDPETGKKTYIPEEYMKITGQGSEAEYPDGYRIKSGKLIPDFGVPKEVEIRK